MGGKSGSQPPAVQDFGMDTAALQQMLTNQQAMLASQMPEMTSVTPPETPEMPEIRRTPTVDWAERQNQITAKARADYMNEQADRRGRNSTISAPVGLDDEETNVTKTLLTGGSDL